MFPRSNRLSRDEFPTAFKIGKRLTSPHFTVIIPRSCKGYAVVIPKKIAKLSVTRHRLKRQIMGVLREISLPPSLIVFPQMSACSVSYKDMKAELEHLLLPTL